VPSPQSVEVAFTLGISSFVMCDAAWWLIDEILHGEYYVSIKVICYLCLPVLSIECQRARADIVFMLHFFLTLDGIAFDHFLPVRISLHRLTLHISEDFFSATFKKLLVITVSFCFSNKAHLLDF
jgi:hypothetical protein